LVSTVVPSFSILDWSEKWEQAVTRIKTIRQIKIVGILALSTIEEFIRRPFESRLSKYLFNVMVVPYYRLLAIIGATDL